jgi:integrase
MIPTSTTFSDPKIVTTQDLNHRSFISFIFNNKPQRLYNGKSINQNINPNRAKTLEEKQRLLNRLRYETHKALEANIYPVNELPSETIGNLNAGKPKINTPAIRLLFEAVRGKLKTDLSKTYKRDLKSVYREFKAFLQPEEANGSVANITSPRIEQFLSQYNSSGTYYMNKRRNLSVIISAAGRTSNLEIKTVKETKRRKAKAKLHKAYDKEQLKPILNYLKTNNSKLYLCCLLTYSSWLRPHEEVRLLTLGNFKKDWTEIHLSGEENKGGKVRVVYIPAYTQAALTPILTKLSRNDNIFSGSADPLNESYFSTAWSRAYKKMFALGLIYENQTIYSFRHTAAVDTYRRTKDVYLLQKLLGHSSILVTLKYLRSLGEFNSEELRDAAPKL